MAAQDAAETASKQAAAVAPAAGAAAVGGGGGGASGEELARVTRKLEAVAAREKALTQDLAAMLEDSNYTIDPPFVSGVWCILRDRLWLQARLRKRATKK